MLSFCRGSEGFSDKTTEEQLNSLISSLRDEFQEPPDAKCRRLAAELSAMKQDPSETVDEFAFKYKNTIHQLDKLGESLTNSCPTYVTSQFIGTFSIRFFVGNGKPQTAKCHVTTSLRSRLQFAVHV